MMFSFNVSGSNMDWESRHHGSIDRFEGDGTSKTITFNSAGNDSSSVIGLPNNSQITYASINIEGKTVQSGGLSVINYSDTNSNKAWEDSTNTEFPITSSPSKFMTNQFSTIDYDDVKTLDSRSKTTTSGFSGSGYPIQLFEFDLTGFNIINFEVFWVGFYFHWNSEPDKLNVSIWNDTGKAWEIVGNYLVGSGVSPSGDVLISKSFNKDYGDYIHPTSNKLYILVCGTFGAGMSYCDIGTNYISLNISTPLVQLYPKDPYLDIGGDGDKEWIFSGDLDIKQTFSGNTFINELREQIDYTTAIGDNVYIEFEFGSNSPGGLFITNLSIEYIINQGPKTTKEIPDISFDEDSGWFYPGINVTSYFQDGDDPYTDLTFELNGVSTDIWGEVTPNGLLKLTSSENYSGQAEFNISCRDKGFNGITSNDDYIIYSNTFAVDVMPVDDPPVIKTINGEQISNNIIYHSATEKKFLDLNILAEDVDGDDIRYSVNIIDNAISVIDNKISFLPAQKHVGTFNFTVIATEINLSKLYDSVEICINVENVNDLPEIIGLEQIYSSHEDTWMNLTVEAVDPDLENVKNEKLTFKTNFSDTGVDPESWYLNENSGFFSFLPTNEFVGEYHLEFTVSDNFGGEGFFKTIIEIKNVNDLPKAKPIYSSKLEGFKWSFSTEPAKDPDIIHGDVLRYSWDFDRSDGIQEDVLGRNVSWAFSKPGNYDVTLTVTDSGEPNLSDTISINIVISESETGKPDKENGNDESNNDLNDLSF
jgi:hypothetical protein